MTVSPNWVERPSGRAQPLLTSLVTLWAWTDSISLASADEDDESGDELTKIAVPVGMWVSLN